MFKRIEELRGKICPVALVPGYLLSNVPQVKYNAEGHPLPSGHLTQDPVPAIVPRWLGVVLKGGHEN